MKIASRKAASWVTRAAALIVPLWLFGCGATPPVNVGPINSANGQIVLPVSEGATKSTVTLQSAVTGGFQIDPGVNWNVVTANGGTVDQNGVYTAPDVAGSYTVQAVPNAKPNNPVSLTIKVIPKLTVSPTAATVPASGTLTLNATVVGTTNNAINWTVLEAGGGSASGTTTTGTYTAPAAPGTYHVVATLQAESTVHVTIPVIVQSVVVGPGITVSISPTSVNAIVGDVVHFAASVSNAANQNVTWSAPVTATGDFTATAPGDSTITATSVADPTKSANATVHVAPRLTLTPTSQVVVFGTTSTIQFTAKLGTTDVSNSVSWTKTAGTISASGLLTLPGTLTNPTGDTITVTAATSGQPAVSATVTILPVSSTVAPASITVSGIPDASNSIVVDVIDPSIVDPTKRTLLSQIVPRSKFTAAGTKQTVVDFTTLPARLLNIKVTAFPNADATGVVQANNLTNPLDKTSAPVTTVTPTSGSTATATATLASTINSVSITPTPTSATVILGNTIPTLTASALDSDGNTVVVNPGEIGWTSSVAVTATVPAAGQGTLSGAVTNLPVAVAPGTTVVTAQEKLTTTNVANQKKATFSLTILSNIGDAQGEVRSAKMKGK